MQTFTPTELQSKLATVFNSVQKHEAAIISGRSRPDMVIVLMSEFDSMNEKIKQLTGLVKKMDGDAHKQKDLLK